MVTTYLTTPFLLAMPGFEVSEVDPWREGDERWRVLRARFPDEGDERWRVLRARFPDSIASHSPVQHFYFGEDFLLRRHDYDVDVAG
jgi:hypothetical protein